MPDEDAPAPDLATLTTDIVAAYVAKNSVRSVDLPALIASVHGALAGLGKPIGAEPEKPTPRLPIRKTITADHLISLEDGKPYRTLKRHLTRLGLTPDTYRAKWGLPGDYPMTAPAYSEQRSKLARERGLGRKPGAKPAPAKRRGARSTKRPE